MKLKILNENNPIKLPFPVIAFALGYIWQQPTTSTSIQSDTVLKGQTDYKLTLYTGSLDVKALKTHQAICLVDVDTGQTLCRAISIFVIK